MKKTSIYIFITIMLLLLVSLISCDAECKHEEFKSKTVEPTCTSEGYTLKECLGCDFSYKTDIVAPIEHKLSAQVTAPACDTQGYTTYSCECGYSYNADFTSPTGHTTRKETYPPTCEAEGYTLSKCVNCSFESRSDFLPAKGHTLTPAVTPPTCEEAGYTSYSCFCGYSYKADITAPAGHELSSLLHAPTCTEQGYSEYSCGNCSYSFISDFTEPTGHTFSSVSTRPTSSLDGFTLHSCECGYEYTGDFIMSDNIFHGAYVNNSTILAHGIDVSKWNGDINWAEIKAAGVDFVIIKAGSTLAKDPRFEEYYASAKAAGLGVGCYYYSYALSVDEISADADLFISWIAGKQFDYPVYLDIEDPAQEALDKSLLTEMCVTFIEKMQINGYFCGIYTNNNWLTNLLHTETITLNFDLWLARWLESGEPDWPSSFGAKAGLWQYTDQGTIGDHSCYFDLNVAFKDYPSLIKQWGYNGY